MAGVGSVVGMGSLRSSPYEDQDGDGIPDAIERSDSYHAYLEDIFGADQFGGLDPERRDLLVDARYIGSAEISNRTKRYLEREFRDHGIHLQWLDYPEQYDHESFEKQYGTQVERVLWPYGSFYAEEIEEPLQDIALQVIVVPEMRGDLESLYTVHHGEEFEGVSFGNRNLVLEQDELEHELVLVMHEIGHLVLCHNDDPQSVMARSPDEAEFTEDEWEELRSNLDTIRDSTGFDVTFRTCVVTEYLEDADII